MINLGSVVLSIKNVFISSYTYFAPSKRKFKKVQLKGPGAETGYSFFYLSQRCHARPFPSYSFDNRRPPLAKSDEGYGLFLIDATWTYAETMHKQIKYPHLIQKRSLPAGYQTAYPRRQEDCSDPARGLASVEALYIAYRILGRDGTGLLDNYYWKEEFLKKNEHLGTT